MNNIDFRIEALSKSMFEEFLCMSDAELSTANGRWLIADSSIGFPCRVSLEDAGEGERILALCYQHHDCDSPYRSSGPIFVRENSETASLGVNEVPQMIRRRLLSVRGYDSGGIMKAAQIVQGDVLEQEITQQFFDEDVSYLHIHNALPGCYSCRVKRESEL